MQPLLDLEGGERLAGPAVEAAVQRRVFRLAVKDRGRNHVSMCRGCDIIFSQQQKSEKIITKKSENLHLAIFFFFLLRSENYRQALLHVQFEFEWELATFGTVAKK